MATTTEQAFQQFESLIKLRETQETKVRERAKGVDDFLRRHFPSTHDIPLATTSLMGSAQRGTIIRPLDDIDVLATFVNRNGVFEKYRHNSQAFLYRLRERIDAKSAVQQVGARGQVVRLFYTDGLHVDIASVFAWSGGGYALPSGSGAWITTDPPKQADWANAREGALSQQFRRRVRLLKRWNREHSARLGSWHLEVLVGEVFTRMSGNHREGLTRFFEWAPNQLHVNDPDGHGGDLAAGLTRKQQEDIKTSLEASRVRAQSALDAELRGNHVEAIRLWRLLLGDEFPTYG